MLLHSTRRPFLPFTAILAANNGLRLGFALFLEILGDPGERNFFAFAFLQRFGVNQVRAHQLVQMISLMMAKATP